MTGWNLVHQAVQYQKVVTDNTFEIISVFQNSSNELLQQSLEQCSWLPEQNRQDYSQWVSGCFTAADYLKKLIDGGYRQLEQQYSSQGKESEELAAKQPVDASTKTKPAATSKVSVVKSPKVTKAAAVKMKNSSVASPLTAAIGGVKEKIAKAPRAAKEVPVKKEVAKTPKAAKEIPVRKEVTKTSKAAAKAPVVKKGSPQVASPVASNPKVTMKKVEEIKNIPATSPPEEIVNDKQKNAQKSS